MARKKTTPRAGSERSYVGKLAGQKYAVVSVDTLTEHPKNPRRGDVEMIQESIGRNDFYGAVIVQKSTGRILAGNHRWKAAKANGMGKIPAILLDVDDATALRILLADNKTSDSATYDDGVLLELLQQANVDGGLDGTGYESGDLARLLTASDPPPLEPPTVPAHDEQSKMVHRCPRCSYEWAARSEKASTSARAGN